jgi:hypothetical protein
MSLPQYLSKPLHGRGCLLVTIAFAAYASPSEARFLEARVDSPTKPTKVRQSLLARTRDPGFFRNYGVRAGVPSEDMGAFGNDGSMYDSTLDRDFWKSDGMSLNFPFLDNMRPIAPMDRVHDGDGAYDMDPAYVAEFQNPDAFPTVVGSGCTCTRPDGAEIECDCGDEGAYNKTRNDHYTWLKDTPIVGTDNYTLTPADITYRAGNYWQPEHPGGIVAPADRLPAAHYPNQAPPDRIWPLPASAAGDRVGIKYARYMDQVHHRMQECDKISKRCTVACRPGDDVILALGNTGINARVVRSFVGNAIQVEFVPAAAASSGFTSSCTIEHHCTAFRFCKGPQSSACVAMQESDSHNWRHQLVVKHACPSGTQVCATVNQVVLADHLQKDGKACKASSIDYEQSSD